jgi:hypothetical protein
LESTLAPAHWRAGHGRCGCSAIPRPRLADIDDGIAAGRGIAESPTLLFALPHALLTHILCGDYAQVQADADELTTLADSKSAMIWKFRGTALQGCLLALTDKSADAVQAIAVGIAGCKSIGTTLWLPVYLSHLAPAHAALGNSTTRNAASAKRDGRNQGNLVAVRDHAPGGGNRPAGGRAGSRGNRSLFPARTQNRPRPAR